MSETHFPAFQGTLLSKNSFFVKKPFDRFDFFGLFSTTSFSYEVKEGGF